MRRVVLAVFLVFAVGCTESSTDGPSYDLTASTQPPSTVGTPDASGKGVVSGTLVMVGGPANARYPVPGSVGVANIRQVGAVFPNVEVGADGTFSVAVDPGTYEVFGQSPNYNGGKGTCIGSPATVRVRAGEQIVVDVQCSMK